MNRIFTFVLFVLVFAFAVSPSAAQSMTLRQYLENTQGKRYFEGHRSVDLDQVMPDGATLADLGLVTYGKYPVRVLPVDYCQTVPACKAEQKRVGNTAQAQALLIQASMPRPDLVRFGSMLELSGKQVCQVGTYPTLALYQTALRTGYYRNPYNMSRGAVWSSGFPVAEFGAVVDLEMHEKLANMAGAVFVGDPKDCDYRIGGFFTNRGEDVSGKGSNGAVMGSLIVMGTRAAAHAVGNNTASDIIADGGQIGGAVLSTRRSQSEEHHVSVKLYQSVTDKWGREVLFATGSGHNLTVWSVKQSLGKTSYAVDEQNAQPVAEGAVLEIITGEKSQATKYAESHASNVDVRIGERQDQTDKDTAERAAKRKPKN